jgi:hypothetical protein
MRYLLPVSGILLLFLAPLTAQYDEVPSFEDTMEVYEDLFYKTEPLNLTMKFNIKEFQKTRRKEKYHPVELTCHVDSNFQVNHRVRVRARGKFRRDYCTMPPYWLNIRHAGIEAEGLQNTVKMKVVTRCKSSPKHEHLVLREYLVYKLYNLLTDYSFNTRLVKIKYIDTGRKMKESEDWGFLIEPNQMMADRNECMIIDSERLSVRTVNKETMDLMAFFNYMIGHGDFSVTGQHNLKILAPKEFGGPTGFLPVPYDFDWSGLINIPYDSPYVAHLSGSPERIYKGPCLSMKELEEILQEMESKRRQVFTLFVEFPYLEDEKKARNIQDLNLFYILTGNRKLIRDAFIKDCTD